MTTAVALPFFDYSEQPESACHSAMEERFRDPGCHLASLLGISVFLPKDVWMTNHSFLLIYTLGTGSRSPLSWRLPPSEGIPRIQWQRQPFAEDKEDILAFKYFTHLFAAL